MAEEQELINSMELQGGTEAKSAQFFEDGVRKIDYVLVYEEDSDEDEEDREKKKTYREAFIHNLKLKHLEIEETTTPKVRTSYNLDPFAN